MKKAVLLSSLCLVMLSACSPTSMTRYQRTGLVNSLSEAAGDGVLYVNVYGAQTVSMAQDIVQTMEGYNHGPQVPMKLARDTGKGVRLVVVLDPGFNAYRENLCKGSDIVFDHEVGGNSKAVFAMCNNQELFSTVSTSYFNGRLAPSGEEFDDFYRQSLRYLTDLQYERMNSRSNCGGSTAKC